MLGTSPNGIIGCEAAWTRRRCYQRVGDPHDSSADCVWRATTVAKRAELDVTAGAQQTDTKTGKKMVANTLSSQPKGRKAIELVN